MPIIITDSLLFLSSRAPEVRGEVAADPFLFFYFSTPGEREPLRYGVVPAGTKGIAPQDAPHRQQTAADKAEALKRLYGVDGTGGGKAADTLGANGHRALIHADEGNQPGGRQIPLTHPSAPPEPPTAPASRGEGQCSYTPTCGCGPQTRCPPRPPADTGDGTPRG